MAKAKPFTPVKLICGIIASRESIFHRAEKELYLNFGPIDFLSQLIPFEFTDYYQKQIGPGLQRKFVSFKDLIDPSKLSEIKLKTNYLEEKIKQELKSKKRVVNLDPGYLTPSALIIATVKNFTHRIPLQKGIYAHLELLFKKREIKTLDWTYPDFKTKEYQKILLEVRKIYLHQLKSRK
ncbi:MAG: DUF4416 family protein [Candidatus Aminicenantia bacterium]